MPAQSVSLFALHQFSLAPLSALPFSLFLTFWKVKGEEAKKKAKCHGEKAQRKQGSPKKTKISKGVKPHLFKPTSVSNILPTGAEKPICSFLRRHRRKTLPRGPKTRQHGALYCPLHKRGTWSEALSQSCGLRSGQEQSDGRLHRSSGAASRCRTMTTRLTNKTLQQRRARPCWHRNSASNIGRLGGFRSLSTGSDVEAPQRQREAGRRLQQTSPQRTNNFASWRPHYDRLGLPSDISDLFPANVRDHECPESGRQRGGASPLTLTHEEPGVYRTRSRRIVSLSFFTQRGAGDHHYTAVQPISSR